MISKSKGKKFGASIALICGSLMASQCVLAEQTNQSLSASEPGPYWVNVGVGYVNFNSSATVSVAGVDVPGQNAAASNNTTLLAEFGYDITKNWAARLTVGIPPTTTLTGKANLAGAGTLGKVGYAPAVLSATYGWDLGVVKPYLGAGVNYAIITSAQNGTINNLSVGNGYGPVLQAGFNVPITPSWAWYADFKQIFVKVNATGTVGPNVPVSSVVTLNPQIWSTGVNYRF